MIEYMIAKLPRGVKLNKRLFGEVAYFVLGGILGLLLLVGLVWSVSKEVILPGVSVSGVNLGGKDFAQAKRVLTEASENYQPTFFYGETVIQVPKEVILFDPDASILEAQKLGRKINLKNISAILSGKIDLPYKTSIHSEQYTKWTEELASYIDIPGKPPVLADVGGVLTLVNGRDGVVLDGELLKENLTRMASYLVSDKWEIPTKEERLALSPEQERSVAAKIRSLEGKVLIIKVEYAKAELAAKELPSFIDLTVDRAGDISEETTATFVQGLADRFERVPQDAKFEFAEGRVKEFAPGLEGIVINKQETVEKIKNGIERLLTNEEQVTVEASITKIPPQISTGEVNNLGITELIGWGESYYAHSIVNRVFNVGLASTRVTGTLVPPGEEFSFNQAVGEISGATGYKTAYVIQNGRTELGDGGGVCQVSTTLFRAAMNAGLPITERWAHAYRVGYYEQDSKPGLDATVYHPSKDLKFRNDTGSYILVQAINDPKNYHLIFELYGSKDGRVATVSTPRVTGVSPPPPDLYQDDPTLPAGQVKQVDWSAWGAKASFDYKVEKNGEVLFAKTFTSNYRPWANVYLKGTMGQ